MILIISIVLILILLGLLSVSKEKKANNNRITEIKKFLDNLVALCEKSTKNQDFSKEYQYYLANSYKMTILMEDTNASYSPVMSLQEKLQLYRKIDGYHIEHIYSNALKVESIVSVKNDALNEQRYNVFTLFYRGIGLILEYIFGYPIQFLYPGFSYTSKIWKTISAIVSILAGLATIIGFVFKITSA